jgi:3-hydroxybutyryl-CoA dehydrogenase
VRQHTPIQSVLVAGAGSIGLGVAHSFARCGFETTVLSRNPARLAGRLPPSVSIVGVLPSTAPDLVVESIPEIHELKTRLYKELEQRYADTPVIASNTSSLSLEDLSLCLANGSRFLGMHYLYPAEATEFVEVTRTSSTSDAVLDRVTMALRRCGKTPIVLGRPVMGALVNRLQHALLREAYHLIGEGIVTPEQIDDVARRLLGPRMCVTGLLEQKDISGLDTHALAQKSLVPHLCHDASPSRCLQERYERGDLGLKTGRGFYDWEGVDAARVRAHTTEMALRILELMNELGIGRGRSLPK